MSRAIRMLTETRIPTTIRKRIVALTGPERVSPVSMPSYIGVPRLVIMSDTHGEIESVLNLYEALPSGLQHIDLGDKVDRGPDPLAMNHLLQTLQVKRTLGNHDAMWLGAGLGIKSLGIELVRWLMRYNEVEFLTAKDQMGIDVKPLRNYADKYFQVGSHRIDIKSEVSKNMEAAATYLKIIAEAATRFPEHKDTILTESDLRVRRALFFTDAIKDLDDTERDRFLALTADSVLSKENSDYFYRLMGGLKTLTNEEETVVNSLTAQFENNSNFYYFVKWMVGQGDIYFTYRANIRSSKLNYPCDIIATHALIPIDENGNLKQVYGEYGHDALKKIKRSIEKGMEAWRHIVDLDDRTMMEMHQKEIFPIIADLPWGVNSPVYGRQMQTAARAVLNEASGLWEEDKEPFYTHFEKNNNTEMSQIARINIARSFNVNPDNFVIVHGHEPTYNAKKDDPNMPGMFKIFAGGTVINIDAGMAKNYGGKGGALVFGTEGAAWLSYPALEFSRVPLPCDSGFSRID